MKEGERERKKTNMTLTAECNVEQKQPCDEYNTIAICVQDS